MLDIYSAVSVFPLPCFVYLLEVAGALNIAVANFKIIFTNILPDTVSTMEAIQEEKCTALIGAPIIFRDILTHPGRKKYHLNSLVYSGTGASSIHLDFLRHINSDFTCCSKL